MIALFAMLHNLCACEFHYLIIVILIIKDEYTTTTEMTAKMRDLILLSTQQLHNEIYLYTKYSELNIRRRRLTPSARYYYLFRRFKRTGTFNAQLAKYPSRTHASVYIIIMLLMLVRKCACSRPCIIRDE